jgi:NAD(P)-dependent dehydrogenase (short-subunit alcohol dehydrogenase family)
VALVDRDAAMLQEAQAEMARTGGVVTAHEAEVTDEPSAARVSKAVTEQWGRLDVLVTAAAISDGKKLADVTPEDWHRVFAVNVTGTYLWIRASIPQMQAQGGGSIVTIASQLAIAGGRSNAAYVAAKNAVIGITRSVALDYAEAGIRCNSVLPGATETPMLARSFARRPDPEAAREASRKRHAMQRLGQAPEIAQAILYFASDESAFTTGTCLPVDGGWLVA